MRHWRRERNRVNAIIDDIQIPVPEAPPADEALLEQLYTALNTLSDKQRLAIDFRFRWGWPYWAVAAAIDTTEPTARVHVMRGRARLRALIGDPRRAS